MQWRLALQGISWLALGLTILPTVLYLTGQMELDPAKWLMLLATIVWFAVTPLWMDRAT